MAESAVRELSNSISPNRLLPGTEDPSHNEELKNDFDLDDGLEDENFDYYNSEKSQSQL